MGIADDIANGVFNDAGVTDEDRNELKVKIAAAGLPMIDILTKTFAADTSNPTATELAEMAVAAKEVTEFLTGQAMEAVEKEMVLAALQELVGSVFGDDE